MCKARGTRTHARIINPPSRPRLITYRALDRDALINWNAMDIANVLPFTTGGRCSTTCRHVTFKVILKKSQTQNNFLTFWSAKCIFLTRGIFWNISFIMKILRDCYIIIQYWGYHVNACSQKLNDDTTFRRFRVHALRSATVVESGLSEWNGTASDSYSIFSTGRFC